MDFFTFSVLTGMVVGALTAAIEHLLTTATHDVEARN